MSKRDYLVHDTVYQIALLFYWMRRIREEFADKGVLGPFAKEIEQANDALGRAFSESYCLGERAALETFAGQRDAIAMLMEDDSKKHPIHYGEFRRRLQDGVFAHWFDPLLKDVASIVDLPFDRNVNSNRSDCWMKGSVQRARKISERTKMLLNA
eukprot:CAMPEP_0169158600 /NCGR_PEP_ID=MMETSP1015-20121227/55298_1 /TAXON_ID=342587 /ORGANISM="Karlodinium micrum, Strain CCMP2283" /LENGTH=154 /DNA_ID=CAMNT_0009229801 /DNA_START=179 /DNA_END=639 /DNA_ORIENTATION=+